MGGRSRRHHALAQISYGADSLAAGPWRQVLAKSLRRWRCLSFHPVRPVMMPGIASLE
ncbi:hypothetical protein O23A_p1497 [Aeromonas salmonicida]|nr:hypothetical protein O23A_p1497 [Aeromonas salmonicida]